MQWKYFNISIIMVIAFFMGTNCIEAKDIEKTCIYNTPVTVAAEKQTNILCEIYTGNTHKCYMEVGGAKATPSSNSEEIINWKSAQGPINEKFSALDYYKENKSCPQYLIAKIDVAIGGYEIYAAKTESSANRFHEWKYGNLTHVNTVIASIIDTNASEIEQQIDTYIEAIKDFSRFSFDDCYYKASTPNPLESLKQYCRPTLENYFDKIKEYQEDVQKIIDEKKIDESSSKVKEFNKVVNDTNKRLNVAKVCMDNEISAREENKSPNTIVTECYNGNLNFDDINVGGNSDDDDTGLTQCAILGEHVTPIVKWAIRIIQILSIVLIVVLTIVDFAGIVISGEEKNFKEAGTRFVKRLIAGIAILFAPALLTYLIDISGILGQYGIDRNELFCSLF